MRGRGSKHLRPDRRRTGAESPPMRGRGSKQPALLHGRHCPASPPMRGRGSKLEIEGVDVDADGRPPCGGVDRNTGAIVRKDPVIVAPHAGAWIETRRRGAGSQGRRGRPPCGDADRNVTAVADHCAVQGRPPCGGVDRNNDIANRTSIPMVAPHAGAWIETSKSPFASIAGASPPMRGRGSKPIPPTASTRRRRRPPCGGGLCCNPPSGLREGGDRRVGWLVRPLQAQAAR